MSGGFSAGLQTIWEFSADCGVVFDFFCHVLRFPVHGSVGRIQALQSLIQVFTSTLVDAGGINGELAEVYLTPSVFVSLGDVPQVPEIHSWT